MHIEGFGYGLERQILENRRELIKEIYRRIEEALRPFARALDSFLATLFQDRLPADWRQQWHAFIADQATEGFKVNPQSVRELEEWIETWARFCGLLPIEEARVANARGATNASADESEHPIRYPNVPGAALLPSIGVPEGIEPTIVASENVSPPPTTGRGDQSQFVEEAEEIVSEEIGVRRNLPGPQQQRIPGSGRGGFRILDFPHRGQEGSVRLRGTVVEVKASATGTKFGDLSDRSRQQIKDAIEFVLTLRSKASLVKDPTVKALLEKAHVEVFSDLPRPKTGQFATLIEDKLLDWKQIPRPEPARVQAGSPRAVPDPARSIGKPGLGAAENIALGLAISLVEAGIANALYRESAAVLNDLLHQIAKNDEADENAWRSIQAKLNEVANMKQSLLGHAWEVISYGQGSLQEKQAIAMMLLASDLAEKYGYGNKKTWDEMLRGGQGHFEKKP